MDSNSTCKFAPHQHSMQIVLVTNFSQRNFSLHSRSGPIVRPVDTFSNNHCFLIDRNDAKKKTTKNWDKTKTCSSQYSIDTFRIYWLITLCTLARTGLNRKKQHFSLESCHWCYFRGIFRFFIRWHARLSQCGGGLVYTIASSVCYVNGGNVACFFVFRKWLIIPFESVILYQLQYSRIPSIKRWLWIIWQDMQIFHYSSFLFHFAWKFRYFIAPKHFTNISFAFCSSLSLAGMTVNWPTHSTDSYISSIATHELAEVSEALWLFSHDSNRNGT